MARIKALPGIEVIRGFKGTIDFYLWKGLPCARKWPYTPRSKRTAGTIAAAALFGEVLKSYRLLADEVLALFREDAADQPRTARDIYASAALGHLHEASMSDFLDLLTECRNSLSALEALLAALGSVDTDDLQVDVRTSALPTGAATAAHQVTQTTALQTLDDLAEALQSVNTDRLQVRGEDQLFSLNDTLLWSGTYTMPGAGNYSHDTAAVPAGQWWVVTGIHAHNQNSVPTRVFASIVRAATTYWLDSRASPVIWEGINWTGWAVLKVDDSIRVRWLDNANGDTLALHVTGFRITLET